MKIQTLIEITNEVDYIFHKNGYILDHNELSHALFAIMKKEYPDETLNR